MIDLRSDTITIPRKEMLMTINTAQLGDDGRISEITGKGEDETTNRLEEICAHITGKEDSCFVPSGTFANTVSIMALSSPENKILVDDTMHLYRSEKALFSKKIANLKPLFYKLKDNGKPDISSIKTILDSYEVKVMCIENTHNFRGGVVLSPNEIREIYECAKRRNVHVYMDGARLFNAVAALNLKTKEICQYVDSLMFCFSKGLGAPIGSIVCGEKEFIKEVREMRKILGGGLRQSGVITAPAIYAIENNIEKLAEDNKKAFKFASGIENLEKIYVDIEKVQSNIVMIDVSKTNKTANEVVEILIKNGLCLGVVEKNLIRAVFHQDVTQEDVVNAIGICKSVFE